RLARDDPALDAVVDVRRQDLLPDQIVLALVRPSLDDRLRARGADAGQRIQLLLRRRVDVDESRVRGYLPRRRTRRWRGARRLRRPGPSPGLRPEPRPARGSRTIKQAAKPRPQPRQSQIYA